MTQPIIKRYVELSGEWDSLKLLIDGNRTTDYNETEAGIQMAGGFGKCPHDVDGLRRIRDEECFRTLDKEVQEVTTLIGEYAQKDVAQDLYDKKGQWEELRKEIVLIRDDVKLHQKVDKWVGDAAEKYEALLPTQIKALEELTGLSNSQGRSCDQMSMINAQVFLQTINAIAEIRCRLNNVEGSPRVPIYGDETINGKPYLDYYYCRRSYMATSLLQDLKAWIIRQKTLSQADWAYAANVLDYDLRQIPDQTNNLQPHGVWPGIGKVVDAGPAATGGAGSNSGPGVNGANVSDDGTYINFN